MKHLHALTASTVLALAAGCGREAPAPAPAPPSANQTASATWLGTPVVIASPAGAGARFPNFATSATGSTLVMSWVEPGASQGEFRLRYARWQPDRSWSTPLDAASGKDWFVNWADFPSVAPADTGPWAAHWLQQKPGGVYAYDVMVRVSNDAGQTWSKPHAQHADGTATEHGFVSLAQVNGEPYAVWLDGRATTGEGHDHAGGDHAAAQGAMTLRGAALQPDRADDGVEIDGRVCDCCQTDVAATQDALVVVYRDRSADETRDIHAARLVDGVWTAPVAVHADGWKIDACPVNGPAVAARGNEIAVAWFTAPDAPRVRLAFSADGGRTFAAPIEVASGKVVGRVDVVLLADGRAVVSWLAESANGAVVRAQPFTRAGPAAATVDVAQSDVARSSGFPQLASVPGGLLFAWTGKNASDPVVHTVFAPLP